MASTRSSLASQPPSPFAKPASYAAAPFPSPSAAQPDLTDFLPKFRFRKDHASCVTHSKAEFPPATASPVHELSESPAISAAIAVPKPSPPLCRKLLRSRKFPLLRFRRIRLSRQLKRRAPRTPYLISTRTLTPTS